MTDDEAGRLHAPATGALIVYPTVSADHIGLAPIPDNRITIGFHLVTPMSTMPLNGKLIKWQTRDSSNPTAVVIDTKS